MSNMIRYQDYLYKSVDDLTDVDKVGVKCSNPRNLQGVKEIEVAFTRIEFRWYVRNDMSVEGYLSSAERRMLCDFCLYLYQQGFVDNPTDVRAENGFVLCTFSRKH